MFMLAIALPYCVKQRRRIERFLSQLNVEDQSKTVIFLKNYQTYPTIRTLAK